MDPGSVNVEEINTSMLTKRNGEADYLVTVINSSEQPVEVILSLDIYPMERPSHPKRHLGYWNTRIALAPGKNEILSSLRFPETLFEIDGKASSTDDKWIGPYRSNGLYAVNFCVYDATKTGSTPAVSGARRVQMIVIDDVPVSEAILKSWPGKERRDPPVYMPDYITLASISRIIKDFASNKCKEGARVLDVGSGIKPYYPFFIDKVDEYIGVDLFPGDVVDVVASSDKLPFEDESFDVVISTQVFEHLAEPGLTAKEIYRVLKPGGMALVSLPFVWEVHDVPKDYWRYSIDGVKKLFSSFAEIEVEANGSSMECFVQAFNGIVQRRVWPVHRLSLVKKAFFAINNFFATLLWSRSKDLRFTPNYTAIMYK